MPVPHRRPTSKPIAVPCSRQSALQKEECKRQKCKTYSRQDSPMVTHLTTNYPICSLNMAERTGCLVFYNLWPYVRRTFLQSYISVHNGRLPDGGGLWRPRFGAGVPCVPHDRLDLTISTHCCPSLPYSTESYGALVQYLEHNSLSHVVLTATYDSIRMVRHTRHTVASPTHLFTCETLPKRKVCTLLMVSLAIRYRVTCVQCYRSFS